MDTAGDCAGQWPAPVAGQLDQILAAVKEARAVFVALALAQAADNRSQPCLAGSPLEPGGPEPPLPMSVVA